MGRLEFEMERIRKPATKYVTYVAKMPGPSVDIAASLEILIDEFNIPDRNPEKLPKKLKATIEWE